jgi:hypothetical protein
MPLLRRRCTGCGAAYAPKSEGQAGQWLRAIAGAAVGLVLLVLVVLAVSKADVKIDPGDDEPSPGSCADVYERHLDNARDNGVEPDDRSSFLRECEAGRDALSNAP